MYAEEKIKEAFTQALGGAIREKGFTHKALAESYGAAYRTFRRYITGERDMTVQMFIRVCHIIGISTEEVLRRTELILSEAPDNVTHMFPGDSAERERKQAASPTKDGDDEPDFE